MPDDSDQLTRLNAALAGRYRIEHELGHGGMATVCLAQDLKHDRPVALKVLRPELAAALGTERFFREVRITARLHHPHILPLLDSGEAGGFVFYTMPYVEGESLRERLARETQLPVDDALQIAREVADALSYAHSHDVVHRDVKPENILLESGHAVVADFGIARAITAAGGEQLTGTGLTVGTPAYMSPEQGAGSANLDGRSDLYSLGCVVYEMLAGHPPFTGGTAQEVLARHSLDIVPRLTAARPTVPRTIELALDKVLAKVPADRFRTADQFADALSGRIQAMRSRPGARAMMRSALGFAVIFVLTWAVMRTSKHFGRVRALRPESVQLTFSGNALTPALSADGQRLAYSARRCDGDGRCTTDVIVQDVEGTGRTTVARNLAVWDIQWTSDGRYLVINGWPGGKEYGPFRLPSLGGEGPVYLGCCRGVIIGNSDTVLVAEHPGSNSGAWVRWVTIADAVTRDSLLIPKGAGGIRIYPLSGGRLLKEFWPGAPDVVVSVLDPRGRPLDSLRLEARRLRVLQPTPDGKALLVGLVGRDFFYAGPSSSSEAVPLDLMRLPISGDGRMGSRPDTIEVGMVRASVRAGMLSIARNGTLTYASGLASYEVWLLDRSGGNRHSTARRRLAVATGFLDGKLSPDGRHVGILRAVVRKGRQLKQLSVMRADSGPESLVASPQDVVAWEWNPDDSGMLFALREGQNVVFRTVELASGTSRVVAQMEVDKLAMSGSRFAALRGGGLVVPQRSWTQICRMGAPGLADTSFDIPNPSQLAFSFAPSPDGLAVALVSSSQSLDTILVHRFSLVTGHVDRLAAFAFKDPWGPPMWLADGRLIVYVRSNVGTVEAYVVPAGRGQPRQIDGAPMGPASYQWSADGRRLLAVVHNGLFDIFAIRNFGQLLEE